MKKLFSLACMLLTVASAFALAITPGKVYKINNFNDGNAFLQDNGVGIICVGALNADSYWTFEATSNDGCFYVKNVTTGKYMQEVSTTSEVEVALGEAKVEFHVVNDGAKGADIFGLTSTNQSNSDFGAGCLGLNWKNNGRAQSFAAVLGANPRSFWKLTEVTMPRYNGVAPGDIKDGQSYYLYNVDFGTWLGDNDRNTAYGWTSHAEVGVRGRDIKFVKNGSGWKLDPKMGNNHSINANNLYMDTNDGVSTWTIEATGGMCNEVKIKSGNYGLAVNDAGDMDQNADNGNRHNKWLIVTREERLAKMQEGEDISWVVLGGTFPVADDHRGTAWQGEKGSNGNGGDGFYHCNRVWELWGISNRDVYQNISLPNGRYEIGGRAIYVSTGNDGQNQDRYNEYVADPTGNTKGVIYGNGVSTPMHNVYEYASNERVNDRFTRDLGNGKWTMNGTTEFATNMFEGKGEVTPVETEVTDGTLRVGFKVEGASSAWMLINNINVKYLGASVAKALYFTETEARLAEGETVKYVPTCENMEPNFVWESSNAEVATVAEDGTVTGVGNGTVTISCHTTSDPGIVASYKVFAYAVPSSYTELEYISHVGDRRENPITTNYVAKANTDVEVKFHINSRGSWRAIFSGRGNTDGDDAAKGISLYQNGGNENFGYFVGGYREDNFLGGNTVNSTHVAKASLARLDMDGNVRNTGRSEFTASVNPISMFSNPKNDHSFEGNIYYLTIREGEDVVRNYVPVMRHDGAYGFYETVEGNFVQPVENYNGYGFGEKAGKTYVYYPAADRTVMAGLTAQFVPAVVNGEATFTYESANTGIATVEADGTVMGISAGKTTITATTTAYGSWTASYEIEVIAMNATRTDVNGIGYMAVKGGSGYGGDGGDKCPEYVTDGKLDTKFCGAKGNAWVIQLASEPVAVKQYSFVTGADTQSYADRNPKTFKLEGSNDMINWTTIHEMNNPYDIKALNKEEYVFEVNDETKYRFFKFTATNGISDCVQFAEVWINEQPQTFGDPEVTEATCKAIGVSKVTSNLGAVRTTYTANTNRHSFIDGICSVCGQSATILAANGQESPYTVKYKHGYRVNNVWPAAPAENWTAVDYDDSEWADIIMPIGSNGYDNGANEGAKYNTIWCDEYNSFYMRREFYINDFSEFDTYTLKTLHDDRYQVYINGTLITEDMRGDGAWTGGTNWIKTTDMKGAIREGKNVIAIYIEQNWGGAYCDFSLERAYATCKATVGEAGYATFVAPFDIVEIPNGVEACAATVNAENNNETVHLETVTEIPAGEAVILKNKGEYTFTRAIGANATLGKANDLKAATEEITANGTQYILAKQGDVVGFSKATPDSKIAAGKGYLVITGSAAVKAFYPFGEETATGIIDVNANANQEIYNLAGQRISKAVKGINIVNGKKVLK